MPKITIDIDEQNKLLEQTLPWELSLRVSGVDYPTQRPTVAQVGLLERAKDLSNEEGYALLLGLFPDPGNSPAAPVRSWTQEQVQGVLAAYWAYLFERSKKKAKGMATAVREAIASQGNSSGT